MLLSSKFKKAFFLISFFQISIGSELSNNLSVLISYGYGDNAFNATQSYRCFYPSLLTLSQKENNKSIYNFVYSPIFIKDSLKKSIFNKNKYISCLDETVKKNITNNPFVAIGHSRGAYMLLNYIACHNPKNLQALILFATPISIGQIAKQKLFFWSSSNNLNASEIEDTIRNIKNKSLPIILFHQKNDSLVTINHSHKICKLLKRSGFNNVYFVEMISGGHNTIFDRNSYDVLQGFYNKYNLPYDSTILDLSAIDKYKV